MDTPNNKRYHPMEAITPPETITFQGKADLTHAFSRHCKTNRGHRRSHTRSTLPGRSVPAVAQQQAPGTHPAEPQASRPPRPAPGPRFPHLSPTPPAERRLSQMLPLQPLSRRSGSQSHTFPPGRRCSPLTLHLADRFLFAPANRRGRARAAGICSLAGCSGSGWRCTVRLLGARAASPQSEAGAGGCCALTASSARARVCGR